MANSHCRILESEHVVYFHQTVEQEDGLKFRPRPPMQQISRFFRTGHPRIVEPLDNEVLCFQEGGSIE